MIIRQGNTYQLPVKLSMRGKVIKDTDVKTVEFVFGSIRKCYPEEVSFENDLFLVFLSQEETFSLSAKASCIYQVRVLFADGSVKGSDPIEVNVGVSASKEVLI